MDALTAISTRRTPQNEQADSRQVPNAAGGYGFKLGDEARIHRFLTLGVDGGTYYISERDLTKDNAEVVLRTVRERGTWLVDLIVEISTAGRAPRQNPAIFALAVASALADDEGRAAALAALPKVCRTGTHLFLFARYVEQFRGWGRGLRRAVANWYTDRDVDDVAYQVVKYRQREGHAQRDLLRLAHPVTDEPSRRALFNWAINGNAEVSRAPGGEERSALAEPKVWQALVDKGMPQTALMRQLPRLTRIGALTGSTQAKVVTQLTDPERLHKARVHPVNILVALRTYASGRSVRGESEWTPDRRIVDALDEAFYRAFRTIEPAGKRTLIALDVSGSMGWTAAGGLPITCRETSAALALVTMATEPDCDVVAFTMGGHSRTARSGISELAISPRQRLDDAIRTVSDLPFGGTDCSLPMAWAEQNGREYDSIIVITDNETWAGQIHPHQALVQYRQCSGIDTRLIVVGMAANDVSIADPSDPGMLDVAGMDSAVPNLIANFSRGTI